MLHLTQGYSMPMFKCLTGKRSLVRIQYVSRVKINDLQRGAVSRFCWGDTVSFLN